MKFLILNVIFGVILYINGKLDRPRGVSKSKSSFYVAGADFTCLDGSLKVPFDHINDDYCDCPDGSDEPGTPACPNGSFHCTNAGHSPLNLPSSRVNDGICDCCDGTDEYDSRVQCQNTCMEMGRAAREEREKMKTLVKEGHQIYKEYSQQGTSAKTERQGELNALQQEKDQLEARKNELKALKEEAELPENEAKDVHKKSWEEQKAQIQQERDEQKCQDAFKELDYNGDTSVSVEEMKLHPEFDIDTNGEVTEEEAKEYLEDKDVVDFYTFQTEVWPNIKEIYKKPEAKPDEEEKPLHLPRSKEPTEEEEPVTQPPVIDDRDDMYDREEDYDEDDDRYDDDDEDDEYGDEDHDDDIQADPVDDEMPEYDEATKLLIAAADKARSDFNVAEQKFKTAESKLNDLNKFLSLDLGSENEFFAIKDACYEFTDREYTYKFCPFEKATQRSKSGGSETSLGRWGRWDGPDDNRYSVMLLDNGQGCWNGPNRSVKVQIKCGVNNELVAASEPNRCEYEYQFVTPAACNKQPEEETKEDHDEL